MANFLSSLLNPLSSIGGSEDTINNLISVLNGGQGSFNMFENTPLSGNNYDAIRQLGSSLMNASKKMDNGENPLQASSLFNGDDSTGNLVGRIGSSITSSLKKSGNNGINSVKNSGVIASNKSARKAARHKYGAEWAETGASIGETIGSEFGPVGQAIGATAGATLGGIGGVLYGNRAGNEIANRAKREANMRMINEASAASGGANERAHDDLLYNNMMKYRNFNSFKYGGEKLPHSGNPNALVDNNEVLMTPHGDIKKAIGKSKGQKSKTDAIPVNIENGTRILSDSLGVDGRSYARMAKNLPKIASKARKVLDSTSASPIDRKTAELNLRASTNAFDKIYAMQEDHKKINAINGAVRRFKLGGKYGLPKFEGGTSGDGYYEKPAFMSLANEFDPKEAESFDRDVWWQQTYLPYLASKLSDNQIADLGYMADELSGEKNSAWNTYYSKYKFNSNPNDIKKLITTPSMMYSAAAQDEINKAKGIDTKQYSTSPGVTQLLHNYIKWHGRNYGPGTHGGNPFADTDAWNRYRDGVNYSAISPVRDPSKMNIIGDIKNVKPEDLVGVGYGLDLKAPTGDKAAAGDTSTTDTETTPENGLKMNPQTPGASSNPAVDNGAIGGYEYNPYGGFGGFNAGNDEYGEYKQDAAIKYHREKANEPIQSRSSRKYHLMGVSPDSYNRYQDDMNVQLATNAAIKAATHSGSGGKSTAAAAIAAMGAGDARARISATKADYDSKSRQQAQQVNTEIAKINSEVDRAIDMETMQSYAKREDHKQQAAKEESELAQHRAQDRSKERANKIAGLEAYLGASRYLSDEELSHARDILRQSGIYMPSKKYNASNAMGKKNAVGDLKLKEKVGNLKIKERAGEFAEKTGKTPIVRIGKNLGKRGVKFAGRVAKPFIELGKATYKRVGKGLNDAADALEDNNSRKKSK